MKGAKLAAIVGRRLGGWAGECIKMHSTPILLFAIGHDHRVGHPLLLMPEDLTERQALALLEMGIAAITKRDAPEGAAEHVRNTLQILTMIEVDNVDATDVAVGAAMARLEQALSALGGGP